MKTVGGCRPVNTAAAWFAARLRVTAEIGEFGTEKKTPDNNSRIIGFIAKN